MYDNFFNKDKFFTLEEIGDIEDALLDILDDYSISKSEYGSIGYYIFYKNLNGMMVSRDKKWIKFINIKFPFNTISSSSKEEFAIDIINLNQRYINMGFISVPGIQHDSFDQLSKNYSMPS